MSRIALRPTVEADLVALGVAAHPYRLRFRTLLDGGDVIGVGGLVYRDDGTVWVTTVLKDAARKAKFALHRAVLQGLEDARTRGVRRLYAIADPTQPRSEAWLAACGFEPTEMFEAAPDEHGPRRIWQWTA